MKKVLSYILVGVGMFLVGFGAGGAGRSAVSADPLASPTPITVTATTTRPATTVTVTAQPSTPPPPAGPAKVVTKDGTYVVGIDIEPGKYKTVGTGSDVPGYFAVLKDPATGSNDLNNVVTNGLPKGQEFVTLKAGQGFFTERLKWEKVG